MRVAVVGATGLVGTKLIQVLEEREFPISEFIPVASARSAGKTIRYKDRDYTVITPEQALEKKPQIALFSAGGNTSLEWAPQFAERGCYVIDNSSAWRMQAHIPLVVPEINAHSLSPEARIIANPNCSTIQMVLVLQPMQQAYGLKRVVVSTYQSVTGTGQQAVEQLFEERTGKPATKPVYPHAIDLNALPHIDVFTPNGYTKEEMKMILETRKIMGLSDLKITATTVRIPTMGGHSESLNVELETAFDLEDVRQLLSQAPGVILQDEPAENLYPMPLTAHEKDEVFVGRIRRDESVQHGLNMWVVADNLRKGAATNAVQIAQTLIAQDWFEANN
ncbi:MAG: aspartate-semialdehyde dehydrogenase [Bacteroidia bacterium]